MINMINKYREKKDILKFNFNLYNFFSKIKFYIILNSLYNILVILICLLIIWFFLLKYMIIDLNENLLDNNSIENLFNNLENNQNMYLNTLLLNINYISFLIFLIIFLLAIHIVYSILNVIRDYLRDFNRYIYLFVFISINIIIIFFSIILLNNFFLNPQLYIINLNNYIINNINIIIIFIPIFWFMQILTSKLRFKEYKIFTNILYLNMQIFGILVWLLLSYYFNNHNVINDLDINIFDNSILNSLNNSSFSIHDGNFQKIILEGNLLIEIKKIIINEAYQLDNFFISIENFLSNNTPILFKIWENNIVTVNWNDYSISFLIVHKALEYTIFILKTLLVIISWIYIIFSVLIKFIIFSFKIYGISLILFLKYNITAYLNYFFTFDKQIILYYLSCLNIDMIYVFIIISSLCLITFYFLLTIVNKNKK